MTKTKKILTRSLICIFGIFWFATLWAKVTFQPLYSDVRFQPSDKLHAGCTNSADILFAPQGQNISKFKIVLYYNPEDIEVLRILPSTTDGILSSKIEYNKIVLEVQNPRFDFSTQTKSFFQISFKSDSVGKETITVWTGSEATTANNKIFPMNGNIDLTFEKVPECEPDIVPPNITLIYPKDTDQRITLDQFFVFDVKDIGKGTDKASVIVNFDREQYFYGSENLKRNGNYLTFYPKKWISIDTSIDLKILVTDQQSYGGANTTESIFSFQSVTGMVLKNNINPMIFRRVVQEANRISSSVDECQVLWNFYTQAKAIHQRELKSIIQKLGCDLSAIDLTLKEASNPIPVLTSDQKQYRNISVFATLGWILFFIAFALKMHYFLAYRKHKKINEKMKK